MYKVYSHWSTSCYKFSSMYGHWPVDKNTFYSITIICLCHCHGSGNQTMGAWTALDLGLPAVRIPADILGCLSASHSLLLPVLLVSTLISHPLSPRLSCCCFVCYCFPWFISANVTFVTECFRCGYQDIATEYQVYKLIITCMIYQHISKPKKGYKAIQGGPERMFYQIWK